MSEKQNIIKNELTAANPCDLHVHTTHSDASRTVAQVIEYAAMIGLKYIAITDHDTMAGVDEAVEIGGKLGVHVVPGVEMSTLDEFALLSAKGSSDDRWISGKYIEMAKRAEVGDGAQST